MPVPNTMDNTYGAVFIGLVASAVLYGITLLQTYLYWRNYADDSRFIKFLVVLLVFLDTLHLVFCTTALYIYLITDFGNPAALLQSIWTMDVQVDFNGLIGIIVECFFARRVWILSRNALLVGIIVLELAIFTVEEFILVDISKFSKLTWVTSAGLGSAAAADILIAISLCYYLMKNRTGFSRTDSLISAVIGYSLTTGLITSILAFAVVITFAVMPTNLINLAVFWLMGRCYVNSFLAVLNSRESLREKVQLDGPFANMSPFRASDTARMQDSEAGLPTPNIDKAGSREMDKHALTVNVEMQTFKKIDLF